MQLIPRFLAGPWHTAKHQSSVDTNYLSDKANISRFNHWYHTSQAKKPKPNKTQNQTKANHQNKTKQKTPNQTQKSFLLKFLAKICVMSCTIWGQNSGGIMCTCSKGFNHTSLLSWGVFTQHSTVLFPLSRQHQPRQEPGLASEGICSSQVSQCRPRLI